MTSVLKELNKNILDNDFIKLFKPLIYAQMIIGSARVNIRHNFVSPPSWIQTAFSFILPTVALYGHSYMSYHYFLDETNIRTVVINTLQASTGLTLCILIVIVNNLVNRDANAELYLTLQKIDRELKVIGKERHNRKIYAFVVLGSIIIIINHLIALITWLPFMNSLLPAIIMPILTTLHSVENFETLSFMTVLLVLCERVRYINRLIDFSIEIRWHQVQLETQVYQRIWQAFNSVLEAFKLTEKLFRIFVLLLVNHLFIYHLMAAAKVIILPEITKFQWKNLVVTPDYMSVKSLVRICFISILVNCVEVNVHQTKESCIHALEKNCDGSSRCYIKNIIRIISTRMAPMTVFRMFPMNNVAVQLLAVTMKYVIVFLQFSLTES